MTRAQRIGVAPTAAAERSTRAGRGIALASLATIGVADWVILRRRPRWVVIGLADEPAHLATAVLVLLNLPPLPRRAALEFLAGSLAIDADHVPLALAPSHPEAGDPRPATHTLLVPAALALAGRRWLALGVLAHFARDVANASGIPLLAPITRRQLRLPYAAYVAAVLALALRVGTRRATLTAGL